MNKRSIVLSLSCILAIIGCKKNSGFDETAAEAHVKSLLKGTLYYQFYSVAYYKNTNLIYTDPSTAQTLYYYPSFVFRDDNTGLYGSSYFTYTIKSSPTVDSVFMTGTFNGKYQVGNLNGYLTLQSTYPISLPFQTASGTTYSDSATALASFGGTQLPHP